MRSSRIHYVLIPLFSLLATLPLLLHGCSCGHDLPFHLQSWLEAAQQWRHGTLYPHWAFSPAWQAGEPRFIFYPPLSWMLGALLTLLFPVNWTPVVFTVLVCSAAGFSMYALARQFAPTSAALVAAVVYLGNPYMLFNAFERAAYAEMMASVWMPLVLLAVLRKRPTIVGIAVPLGLMWLTNAPAAVMASYTLVLLALLRFVLAYLRRPAAAGAVIHAGRRPVTREALLFAGGIALGFALVSFYLLPAAYERQYVQVAMAVIPNLRYQDNFLFSRTDYVAHNVVTHRVSVLAVILLAVTSALLLLNYFLYRNRKREAAAAGRGGDTLISLAVLTTVIAFLLLPVSAPVWEHVPNLAFLQFPWRLLSVLAPILVLTLALVLSRLPEKRSPLQVAFALLAVIGVSMTASHLYRQRCEVNELPAFAAQAFASGHGVLPTDEYTPGDADNDVLRTDSPGYWLTPDPQAYAPGTMQNPNEVYANYDAPIPFEHTVARHAPEHLTLNLAKPETLVLNLRDYPSWRVTRNGSEPVQHIHRDDGLLAIALPAGASTIDVTWQRMGDQKLGTSISLAALVVLGSGLAFGAGRSRKIEDC